MKKVVAISSLLLLIAVGFGVGGYVAYDWIWGTDYHFRAAEEALDRGDFGQAEAHITLVLESRPNNPDAHLLAARIARRAILPVLPRSGEALGFSLVAKSSRGIGSYDKAEQHLAKFKKLGGVAELFNFEQDLLKAQSGALPQVEAELKTLLAREAPETEQILEALVKGYLQAYRPGDALACLDQWLERRENVQALIWRGWVHEHLRQTLAAKTDYQRALELDPENDEARLRLAEMLVGPDPAEAAAHFEILNRKQSADPSVVLGLAQCRRALGDTPEARRLLDQLLARQPRYSSALLERGMIAIEEGQPAEAERWLRQAAALDPFGRLTNYHLYLCLEQLGKKEEARKIKARLDKVIEDLKLMDEATAKVSAAPHDPRWRYEAGMILMRNEQKEEGLRWLLSALEIDPRHAPTHLALADYCEREGKPDLAAYHRRQAEQGRTDGSRRSN